MKNKKGGRPPINDKRKHSVRLYLNDDELSNVRRLLEQSHYKNLNEFVRAALFDKVSLVYIDEGTKQIVYHLSKIGTNVNQIARYFNEFNPKEPHLSKSDIDVLNELKSLLASLGVVR